VRERENEKKIGAGAERGREQAGRVTQKIYVPRKTVRNYNPGANDPAGRAGRPEAGGSMQQVTSRKQ